MLGWPPTFVEHVRVAGLHLSVENRVPEFPRFDRGPSLAWRVVGVEGLRVVKVIGGKSYWWPRLDRGPSLALEGSGGEGDGGGGYWWCGGVVWCGAVVVCCGVVWCGECCGAYCQYDMIKRMCE